MKIKSVVFPVALLLSLALACAGGSGGSGGTVTSETGWSSSALIESYTGSSSSPIVVMDAAGRGMALWEHDDGSTFHILYSEYTPGQGWSWAVPLEHESLMDARLPQISMNTDGLALAVWEQQITGPPSHTSVWAARYIPGSGWSSPELMDASNSNAFYPVVAIDKNGDGLAVWKWENPSSNADLRGCRFTASGGRTNPVTLKADVCLGTGDYPAAALAVDGSGRGYAIWPDGTNSNHIIRGMRFQPATGWDSYATIQSGSTYSSDCRLSMNDSGTAVAIWDQYDGIRYQVQTARYNPSPTPGWGTPELVTSSTEVQSYCSIAIQANGDAMALWAQGPSGTSKILARRYVAGIGWDTPVTLSAEALDNTEPEVVADSQGDWLSVWLHQSPPAAPPIRNIETARYRAGQGWTTPVVLSTKGVDALSPCPVLLPGGKGAVIWNEYSAAQGKVWCSQLK